MLYQESGQDRRATTAQPAGISWIGQVRRRRAGDDRRARPGGAVASPSSGRERKVWVTRPSTAYFASPSHSTTCAIVGRPPSAGSGPELIVPGTVRSRCQTSDQSTLLLAGARHRTSVAGRAGAGAGQVDRLRDADAVEDRVDALLEDRRPGHPRAEHAATVGTRQRLDRARPDWAAPRLAPASRRRASPKRPAAEHDDVEVRMQHPQGGGDEQPDGARPDRPRPGRRGAASAARRAARSTPARRGPRGARGSGRPRYSCDSWATSYLAPAAAERRRRSPSEGGAAGDAGLVEPLADVREPLGAGAARRVEAALHAGQHRVDRDPVALADPRDTPGPTSSTTATISWPGTCRAAR